MKIQELSIGNYVQKPDGEPALICLIKLVKHLDTEEVLLTNESGLSYYAEWLEVKELQPIPITPERLKKIGFDQDSVRLKFMRTIKDIEIEVVSCSKGWIVYVLYPDEEYCRAIVKHIHQLQNFLTLCGIELELKL